MSRLEELIQQYCPDGVEFVEIGQIAQVGTGSSNGNEADEEGAFPFFVRSQTVKRKNDYEYDEEAIIIPGEGGIGDIFHYIKGKYALHQRVYRIHFTTPSINTKFAFYYMKSAFKQFILMKAVSATVVSIRKPMIEGFPIPVPPLPVQEEIVRILDTFTELQAELQAELHKRLQQYAYYKNKLLSGDYPTMKIGDITRVFSASRVHKNEWKTSGVPFYRSSDVMSFHRGEKNTRGEVFISEELFEKLSAKSGKIKIGDLLVTGGGSIGVPYLVSFEPLYVKDADLLCIVKNDILDNRFLYHYMRSEKFKDYLSSITHDATIAHYTISQIKETPVPVPTWDEQQRIITILDKFDTLTNDLSQGLPAEIEARRKQYEYYRDQLLTFKQKA